VLRHKDQRQFLDRNRYKLGQYVVALQNTYGFAPNIEFYNLWNVRSKNNQESSLFAELVFHYGGTKGFKHHLV